MKNNDTTTKNNFSYFQNALKIGLLKCFQGYEASYLVKILPFNTYFKENFYTFHTNFILYIFLKTAL